MILPSPNINSIKFFNLEIKFYAILFLVGFFLLYSILKKDIKKSVFEISETNLLNLSIVIFISAILGARVYHVLTSLNLYKQSGEFNFLKALNIRNGGLGIPGGIFSGIAGGLIYSKIKKLKNYWRLLAIGLPNLLLAQSIGRWGNYFNQELYGRPSNGLVKLEIDLAHRPAYLSNITYYQPLFLYESALTLVAFIIYRVVIKNKYKVNVNFNYSYYFISYGVIRALLEPLRIDDSIFIFNQRFNFVIAILFIVIGTIFALYPLLPRFNKRVDK